MERAVICKGDRTSHGGAVLEGDEHFTIDGRAVARREHMTFCPQCKGNFPIKDGVKTFTAASTDVAVEGMETGCGANLIASQHNFVVDDGTGNAGSAQAAASKAAEDFAGTFRAVYKGTDQPCAGLRYRIDLPDGRSLHGVTDANGETEHLTAKDKATATLYWLVDHSDDATQT